MGSSSLDTGYKESYYRESLDEDMFCTQDQDKDIAIK